RTAGFLGSGLKPWPAICRPSHGVERLKRWFMFTTTTPGLPTVSPPKAVICVPPVLSSRPPRRPRRPPSAQSPFAQLNLGVTFIGEMCATSWEGITPPSSLVLAHSPLPLGSLLLRLSASLRESLQVVTSPCCPRQLPDVIPDSVGIE